MINWKREKDQLMQLITVDKLSYEAIGRHYGCTGSNIKKVAKRLGIPLVNRRKINDKEIFNKKEPHSSVCLNCGHSFILYPSSRGKFCSVECAATFRRNQTIKKWLNGELSGTCAFGSSDFVRNYMMEQAGYKCQRCGWDEINPYTKKTPLQIHHIDGNSLNNRPENLIVLCPNCHALTENFGSRNHNAPNGKSAYYKRSK